MLSPGSIFCIEGACEEIPRYSNPNVAFSLALNDAQTTPLPVLRTAKDTVTSCLSGALVAVPVCTFVVVTARSPKLAVRSLLYVYMRGVGGGWVRGSAGTPVCRGGVWSGV